MVPTSEMGNKLLEMKTKNYIMKKWWSLEHHPAFPGASFMENTFKKQANQNYIGNVNFGTS